MEVCGEYPRSTHSTEDAQNYQFSISNSSQNGIGVSYNPTYTHWNARRPYFPVELADGQNLGGIINSS